MGLKRLDWDQLTETPIVFYVDADNHIGLQQLLSDSVKFRRRFTLAHLKKLTGWDEVLTANQAKSARLWIQRTSQEEKRRLFRSRPSTFDKHPERAAREVLEALPKAALKYLRLEKNRWELIGSEREFVVYQDQLLELNRLTRLLRLPFAFSDIDGLDDWSRRSRGNELWDIFKGHTEKYTPADLKRAHEASSANLSELARSTMLGCFYCLSIDSAADYLDWATANEIGPEQRGLQCMRCGIDSILGDDSGFPINEEFLTIMHNYWF
jgi:hypothetical protein